MAMVCPQCNGSFDQRMQCPVCGIRLLYQAGRQSAAGGLPGQGGQWQHTPWGRIVVGLLLAQGLYHGLRQLCNAGMLALSDEAASDVWKTLFGLMLLQGLQAFGLLVGGIVAGAGQRRGLLLGTVVGVWNGVIVIALDYFRGRPTGGGTLATYALPLNSVTAYGELLLLTAFGALGGLVGSLIWKPLPVLPIPGQDGDRKGAVKFSRKDKVSLFAGPVAWIRVALGTAVVVGGALWANVILSFVLQASEGKLTIRSRLQAHLVTLEICALAVLVGSCLAGATTRNGLKQGLCVGLAAGAVLLGISLSGGQISLNELVFKGLSTSFLAMGRRLVRGPALSPRRPRSPAQKRPYAHNLLNFRG
jgi:hypothetical protein